MFVEASAEDDFGVRDLELVYSVNGGAEKVVKLFGGKRRLPEVTAGHTFYLEELGVEAGDSVSYYARAADNDGVPVPSGRRATSTSCASVRSTRTSARRSRGAAAVAVAAVAATRSTRSPSSSAR